jgi:hypothetical protein
LRAARSMIVIRPEWETIIQTPPLPLAGGHVRVGEL